MEFCGDFRLKEDCLVVSRGGVWLSSDGACDGVESSMVDNEVPVGLLTTVREEVLYFLKFSGISVVFLVCL